MLIKGKLGSSRWRKSTQIFSNRAQDFLYNYQNTVVVRRFYILAIRLSNLGQLKTFKSVYSLTQRIIRPTGYRYRRLLNSFKS